MACWLWLCGVVGAEGLHWAQLTWPAATPPTHQADTADKTDVSCHTSHVTRHTSHSQMESGASLQLVGDNSKRKLGNGREYAGEFTALEWPLVFVAFEKGLVY